MCLHVAEITYSKSQQNKRPFIFLLIAREAWQRASIFLSSEISQTFKTKWSLEYAPYLNKNGAAYTLWR